MKKNIKKARKKERKQKWQELRLQKAKEASAALLMGAAVPAADAVMQESAQEEKSLAQAMAIDTMGQKSKHTMQREVKTRLRIQLETGLTAKGRIAHKTFSIPGLRDDVKQEQLVTAIDALRVILKDPISGADLIEEIITRVWGPEMRINENEEEEMLTNLAQKRETQQNAQMGMTVSSPASQSATNAVQGTASPLSAPATPVEVPFAPLEGNELWSYKKTGMSLSDYRKAVQKYKEAHGLEVAAETEATKEKEVNMMEEVSGKKSLLNKLHDFFIDDSYLKKPAEPEVKQETLKEKQEVPVKDYSHIDWSKESPVAKLLAKFDAERAEKAAAAALVEIPAEEQIAVAEEITAEKEGIAIKEEEPAPLRSAASRNDSGLQSHDFLTYVKANNFVITKEKLDDFMSRSPYDYCKAEVRQNHLTPFTDLDPLIYGEGPVGQ